MIQPERRITRFIEPILSSQLRVAYVYSFMRLRPGIGCCVVFHDALNEYSFTPVVGPQSYTVRAREQRGDFFCALVAYFPGKLHAVLTKIASVFPVREMD